MRAKDFATNVCLTVSAVVGVGFVCGKEAVTFVGNGFNAVVFGGVFLAFLTVLNAFLSKHTAVCDLQTFCQALPLGKVFYVALLFCNFVCVVSVFSALESCLQIVTGVYSPLPVFCFVLCFVCYFLLNGHLQMLKTLSKVSTALVALFFVCCLAKHTPTVGEQTQKVSILRPIVYALFSAPLTLGLLCKIKPSKSQNVFSAICLALLACVALSLAKGAKNSAVPLAKKLTSPMGKTLTICTVTFSAVTSISATALPIVSELTTVTADKDFSVLALLLSALVFSIFGLDNVVSVGYPLVAVLGAVLCIAMMNKGRDTLRSFHSVGMTK